MANAQTPSALTLSIEKQLKAILERGANPSTLEQSYRLLAKWRSHLIENTVVRKQGTVIPRGPFTGMDYNTPAAEGARVARLLGCYEASLAPIIEQIVTQDYEQVIDVGCAEGYYAVGLARRLPKARIIARDTNAHAQSACLALAKLNGVEDRLSIGGAWEHGDFEICRAAKTVVICDIEGAEDVLLDPVKAPGLRHADILVEVHDCFTPGLSDRIAARFDNSHKVETLKRDLDPDALPDWMETFSDLDRMTALWEWRGGPTPWLWMTQRNA